MGDKKKDSWIKVVVVTALAWLGLAGLSDAFVTWQSWFEAGVMEHWRSTKEWIIAVLLDWVPFRVRSWMIDYLVLGLIFARSLLADPPWSELGETRKERVQLFFLFYFGYAWFLAISAVVWPIAVIPNLRNPPEEREDLKNIDFRKRFLLSFVLFIPVLFVCSSILYEHG